MDNLLPDDDLWPDDADLWPDDDLWPDLLSDDDLWCDLLSDDDLWCDLLSDYDWRFACPRCGENDVDRLCLEDDYVTCDSCGYCCRSWSPNS